MGNMFIFGKHSDRRKYCKIEGLSDIADVITAFYKCHYNKHIVLRKM